MKADPRTPLPTLPARRCCALFAAALVLTLAACGGGGGGGTDTTTTTPVDNGSTGGTGGTGSTGGTGDAAAAKASALSAALSSGDARAVDLPTVLEATRTQLAGQQAAWAAERQALFGLAADGSARAGSLAGIDWDPSHDSVTFTLLDRGRNHVMLPGNWRYKGTDPASGRALAVTGQDPATGARYAAFGGNPLAVRGNAAMDAVMKNALGWLTARSDLANLKVVAAHLPGKSTYWFPHEGLVRGWLAAQVPGVVINGVPATQAGTDGGCDGDKLDACLQGADLLVIGRQQGPDGANSSTPDTYPAAYDGATILGAVQAAQARGMPVLYLHHDGDANDLAQRMLAHFGLASSDNYWAEEGLKAYAPAGQAADRSVADTLALLQRLADGSFSTSFSGCVTDTGKTSCSGDAALNDEFLTPATALRSSLRALDAKALALFEQPGYAIEKHLVLLGDKYREAVTYPMDKVAQRAAFFRAHFSDMAAYINRRYSTTARDQGSFAPAIPATTPATSRSVSVDVPATGMREAMTGLYVMPGRTVTLTRTDAGAAAVTVGINMLRDSTRLYNDNGYDRPTLLASPRVALAAGATVRLTSPFGGPLFLFVQASAGAPAVTVQADGATTHPLLRDMRDAAQVAAFKAELASTPTNWVGVTTDFLTVHSTAAHFRATLAAHHDDMSLLADRLWLYMVKDTYELAGFNAASGAFGLPAAVSDFCAGAGWDCTGTQHRRDVMQHVIADTVATCGAGCSGNPYDQNWALEPLGWGETHEIGHNLQRERLKIYGGMSGEVSNNIFPMHKQMAFNRATAPASPMTARSGSTRDAFTLLKASLQAGASATHVHDAMWSDASYAANNSLRLNFYRQLVEYARHYNASFGDGWELYTLVHLLERNFSAPATGTNWAAAKAGLGFGTYAAYPADMGGNDFMLIACSRIIGRDMRPMFALWGVTTSAAAGAQVAAYGLPAAAPLLFPMADLDAYGAGVGAPITMSATATYPGGY